MTPQHEIDLLDRCGNCGSPIPLLANGLRVGVCPACQTDLRTCVAPDSDPMALSASQHYAADYSMLLNPQVWDDPPGYVMQQIGPQLLRLRQQQALTVDQVAEALGIVSSAVMGMESQTRARKGERLVDYQRYSALLGMSMRDLFEQAVDLSEQAAVSRWVVLDIRETTLLEQLEQAVTQLAGAYPAFNRLADHLGVSENRLQQYPAIVQRVKQLQAEHEHHQAEQIEAVRVAAAELAAEGIPVTRTALVRCTGVKEHWFRSKPVLGELLKQYAPQRAACREAQEADLYRRVEAAIQALREQNQPVTYHAVGQRVGKSEAALHHRPALRPLFLASISRRLRTAELDEQGESDLLAQILAIEDQLAAAGESISQLKVCAMLGKPRSQLMAFPRVREYLEHIPLRRQQQKALQDAAYCDQLPDILNDLKREGLPLTLAVVGERLGRSVASLRSHPRTWAMISAALRSEEQAKQLRRQEREDEYLQQIDVIEHELRLAGQPVSPKDIGERLGVEPRNLRPFHRVRIRLQEIAELNRRQKR